MKKLAKSKLFWFAVAYACILAVALVFTLQVEHYECTLEDIDDSGKVLGEVVRYIERENIAPSDEIWLFIYFDHELGDEAIEHIEKVSGANIHQNSCIPADAGQVVCSATCKVENICKLIQLDSVVMIASGSDESWPQ